MQIVNKIINNDNHFIIAEIGHNHGGNLDMCKKMFRIAKECGADAVKLQKRNNKTLYTKAFYDKPYDNENSFGNTYGEHREALEFNFEQYKELQVHAKNLNIIFFATAFDIPSADFLHELDMPAYKIASADITNIPLIRHIYQFQKPMIISTGGATIEDIDRVYLMLRNSINIEISNFAFLHCVATYPNHTSELNLEFIKTMKEKMPELIIGYSNHHPALFTNYIVYVMGARIFEIHFTLNRASKGTDHAFSLEPKGLESLCEDLWRVKQSIGTGDKSILEAEKAAIQKMGKAIWPIKSIAKGEKIIPGENIALKTPMLDGLKPYELSKINNKIAIYDLSTSKPIKEGDYE